MDKYFADENFIRDRVTELRLKKGVSEYKMSRDMGHSNNYIQNIATGRSLPSIGEFLYMCEYFGITPCDFFDDKVENPALLQEAIDGLRTLKEDDLTLILSHIKRLQEK